MYTFFVEDSIWAEKLFDAYLCFGLNLTVNTFWILLLRDADKQGCDTDTYLHFFSSLFSFL